MAKFKKGDVVVCTKPDIGYNQKKYSIGDKVIIQAYANGPIFRAEDGYLYADHWELAAPEPIPETVTIGGVEYVRKQEPEHVWAWGQWARVGSDSEDYDGKVCFVLGPLGKDGWVPVSFVGALGKRNTDGISPSDLTYLGTATIPE